MEPNKTHWREFHPTDYLGAYAFEPNEDKILTIREAHHGRDKGEKGQSEDCLVIHWNERDVKPLIVNVTNSKAISKVAKSSYIEDWKGVAVSLYTAEVNAFGETVEAVRVRQTPPKIKLDSLNPNHPKWMEAVNALSSGKTSIPAIRKHYALSSKDGDLLERASNGEVI